MKFSCYKADLSEALKFVLNAVAVKSATPVLSGVYLKAQNSTLELQGNNLSTGIVTRIPASVEVDGEIVINGKRFAEFVRNMPDDTLTCQLESNALVVDSGGANVELLTMNPADFPLVKVAEGQSSFKIMALVLRELINRTAFATAKENDRPIFTGVLFTVEGDIITAVATDTHRLALAKGKLPNDVPDCSFVVPADSLRVLLNRINPKDVENYVTITYSGRQLGFSFDNVFMTSRLVEGQFPPYQRVIPAESDTHIAVDVAKLKTAVEFVALMAKENKYNTARFTIQEQGICIAANSPDIGNVVKNVALEHFDGRGVDIAFNVNYFADVLRVVTAPLLNIAFNGQFDPALFTEPDNPDSCYVATPVRRA